MFQETGDQQTYQARYVMHHPWRGDVSCEAGHRYIEDLRKRRQAEATTLAQLTGWDRATIRAKMGQGPALPAPRHWWNDLWKKAD